MYLSNTKLRLLYKTLNILKRHYVNSCVIVINSFSILSYDRSKASSILHYSFILFDIIYFLSCLSLFLLLFISTVTSHTIILSNKTTIFYYISHIFHYIYIYSACTVTTRERFSAMMNSEVTVSANTGRHIALKSLSNLC
jgi:hypothetical protein